MQTRVKSLPVARSYLVNMKPNIKFSAFIFIVYCVFESSLSTEIGRSAKSKVLSRRRRYVTFPEGSSFSCAVCITVGLIGQPAPSSFPGVFVMALNWGIAYELPNETETLSLYHKKLKKPVAQRRNRRQLYQKLEALLDNMGYNGRECILKTICETTQRIVPHGDNMLEEIFRMIFTLPITRVLPTEPPVHGIYDAAHRLGRLLENCDIYKCPVSMVDLAQGYYNAPPPKLDPEKSPWSLFSSNFG